MVSLSNRPHKKFRRHFLEMESHQEMFSHIGTYLDTVEEVQPPPLHTQLSEGWWSMVAKDWNVFIQDIEASDDFQEKAKNVFECFQLGYDCLSDISTVNEDRNNLKEHIEHILTKPQSAQRTEEWYKEAKRTLTASEFYQLFSAPRTRGSLVLSKINQDVEFTSPRTCCLTMEMTPLDWGIRFEPVAKMILENKWNVHISELGRIHHPTQKGLAASPDGLITLPEDSELYGNLVEIKCPSSRSIGKGVPRDYWYQMQLQLEVTQMKVCQYSEFHFKSYTAQSQNEPFTFPENALQKGILLIIQNEDLQKLEYRYGPLGDTEWNPTLEDGWELLERVPWYLEKIWIQPVVRDEAWFESILPLIEEFWQDVEKANQGNFILPESQTKKKSIACAIVD